MLMLAHFLHHFSKVSFLHLSLRVLQQEVVKTLLDLSLLHATGGCQDVNILLSQDWSATSIAHD